MPDGCARVGYQAGVRIHPLNEHPERFEHALALLERGWPAWFRGARRVTGGVRLADRMRQWPALQLLAWDQGPVALANAVPLGWDGWVDALPVQGWDWALDSAAHGPTLCALAVTVAPERRGQGISARMLRALGALRDAHGYRRLIVPVRPNGRPSQVPVEAWIHARRADGLPQDPWLRTHVRVGGRPLHVCHQSMQLRASAEEWAGWTQGALDEGDHELPTLLAPLQVRAGEGRYVEPNVWVVHG